MWKHYFKTAWRSLKVNRFYSALNITGLAIGLTTGIMLLLWVQNELSYDKFNKQYKNIYRVNLQSTSNGSSAVFSTVPGPIKIFAEKIPGIVSTVRTYTDNNVILSNSGDTKVISGNKIVYADSRFLNLFDFTLVTGKRAIFLPGDHSVALTESTVKRLFGSGNPLGKVVRFNKDNFTVTSVLQDVPQNSSIQFDAVFPMTYHGEQFTKGGGNINWKTIDEDLGDYDFDTYILVNKNANLSKIAKTFTLQYSNNQKPKIQFQLQRFADIHLTGADGNTSGLRMVEIMLLVAVLILAIASINYVNLSTARSLIRAKEVSIKKIIGANKRQLFFQFISETLLLFLFAIVIAIGLIFALMPLYSSISGKQLSFSLSDIHTLEILFTVVSGTLIASSIYPALLLSSFKPLSAMRGTTIAGFKTTFFRKALVVLQFAISFILLVATIVMSKQMNYVRSKDLGYDKSYVFSVPMTGEASKHWDAINAELSKNPSIVNVGASNAYDITNMQNATADLVWKSMTNMMWVGQLSADRNFVSMMKYQFTEGNNFPDKADDTTDYILNETAVKQMGLKPPYVGQTIYFHQWTGKIIGIVKDFNFKPLTEAITPLIIYSGWKSILYIKTAGTKAEQAIQAVEAQYKKYADNTPFSYNFLDKSFEAKYQAQHQAGTLFNAFAIIAVFISCLGLFGLATYSANVKTKEISIRKIYGASVGSIVQLICKDFLKLVVIAIVIAIPIAYLAMNKWLNGFTYKTSIGIFTFIIAAAIVMLIAFGTIGFKAFKAARANPVKSLKTE
ncbi:MAG TPA: ABC transporter permease [Arachidicoccus sp.]